MRQREELKVSVVVHRICSFHGEDCQGEKGNAMAVCCGRQIGILPPPGQRDGKYSICLIQRQ